MDKISVIIPTYNRSDTILRSVNSVLKQTYENIELLIVDDGSTDNTKELIEQIDDSRIHYIYLATNRGVSTARNTGVQFAAGSWIAFHDSDDAWRPEKLEKQMSYALEHPEYNMIYCSYLANLYTNEKIVCPEKPYSDIMEGNLLNTLLSYNVIGAPTILVKREAYIQTGGFDTSYKSLEDWEFVIRFSKNNLIGFLPDILMDVYLLKGGVSSNSAAYFDSRCRMLAEYRTDIVELGLFDSIAMNILTQARNRGVQDQVKNLMMLYLQTIPPKY